MQLTIPNTFANGTGEINIIDAPKMNANFSAVAGVLNGHIDTDNLALGTGIAQKANNETITGVWTFSGNPIFNANAIPNSALQVSVMLKTTYDADADGIVDNAEALEGHDAAYFATADHNHDAAYAPIDKGVTNGDAHDHVGGDGAAIPEEGLSFSDVTTGDVDIVTHGFCPKAPDDITKFLRGDGAWAVAPPAGYALQVICGAMFSPNDGATYYFGGYGDGPKTTTDNVIVIPRTGTLKIAVARWVAKGIAGSGENISVYIYHNNTTDYLVGTIGEVSAQKVFNKNDLDIAVAEGDIITFKVVCPTWSTNPTNVTVVGSVFIE